MPRKSVITQQKTAPAADKQSPALAAASRTKEAKKVILHLPQPHPKQHELLNMFKAFPGVRFVAGACGWPLALACQLST